jgi:hypothetical protein
MEEIAEDGLDDVVGIEAAGKGGRAFSPGESTESIGVSFVEDAGRFSVPALKSEKQVGVRRPGVALQRRWGCGTCSSSDQCR